VTGPVLRMRISVKESALVAGSPVLCPATPAALLLELLQTLAAQRKANANGRSAEWSWGFWTSRSNVQRRATNPALLHERTRLAVAVYSVLVADGHCHPCPARLIAIDRRPRRLDRLTPRNK
jgi:hypothetical protein